jgi:hypothetical protein
MMPRWSNRDPIPRRSIHSPGSSRSSTRRIRLRDMTIFLIVEDARRLVGLLESVRIVESRLAPDRSMQSCFPGLGRQSGLVSSARVDGGRSDLRC